MKIATKVNLLTTAWIIFILLITNVFVYFSFLTITVSTEKEVIVRNAQEIIRNHAKQDPQHWTMESLQPYLTDHSFIRIVDPHSKIVKEVTDDHFLTHIEADFSTKQESKLDHTHEEQILIVRVPIPFQHHVAGTLEIGEQLMGLETRKDILLSILAVCSAVAIVLSLLGGRWVSRVMMQPISNMITTMKEIEQSGVPKPILIQSNTTKELQNMASTFNHMIERLQENLEKQKQFVSDASHELKTPLTVIKSYADLLRRRGIKSEAIAIEAIEAIYLEANRMQNMTENLLDLAASEKENLLEIQSVDLIQMCQHTLQHLQRVHKREILFHYHEAPIVVEVDELKIKQVMIILLDNAIKYSRDKIEVFIEKSETVVTLRVRDYGIGIPKEDIEHVFERFYRVDKSRSRKTGGMGLGLAIAKNIIKHHTGEIHIKSEKGKGTEVKLQLPVSYDAH